MTSSANPTRSARSISLAGQQASLDDRLTGRENLMLLGRLQKVPRHEAFARTDELLERFGIAHAADRQVGTYSGGMRRRLDLAACLVVERPVVFLDEPTTGLDPSSRIEMWDAIAQLVDNGAALLLTTQYLEEADRLADEIVVLNGGRTVAAGTPAELKARVGARRVHVTRRRPRGRRAAVRAPRPGTRPAHPQALAPRPRRPARPASRARRTRRRRLHGRRGVALASPPSTTRSSHSPGSGSR